MSHQCNAAFRCRLAVEDPKQDSELKDEERYKGIKGRLIQTETLIAKFKC